MNKPKAPTIKDTNRAYVRLYKHVIQQHEWEVFKAAYNVQIISFGMRKYGDCGVHVLDSNGELASLGNNIPNKITYCNFIEPSRVTWQEYYKDGSTTKCVTDSS